MRFPIRIPFIKSHNIVCSTFEPAHEENLGEAPNATHLHVSELTDTGHHHDVLLSEPLGPGGAFSDFRVAVPAQHARFGRRHGLAVKEVYVDKAEAAQHHKAPTSRAALVHEQAMQKRAHAEGVLYTLEDHGHIFQFMRCKNGDLFDAVTSGAWTSKRAYALALQVLSQVGEQLDRAHRHHIVHNDVKLENVLWKTDGSLYLIDFGGARDLAHDSLSMEDTYTPQYAAPERLAHKAVGTASDVWALGVMVLQILCRGKHPLMVKEDGEEGGKERMLRTLRRRTDTYARWHHIHGSEPDIERFARQLRLDFGGRLVDFLLLRILHPNPTRRATAGDCASFAGAMQGIVAGYRTRQFFKAAAAQKTCRAAPDALDTLNQVADHKLVPVP